MMMMMIMIAGLVDSITTPINSWLDRVVDHHKTANMTVKEVGDDGSLVDCIVCLSEVGLGERFAMLERCKHEFHVECVKAWIKDHQNCPLCRTPTNHKGGVYLKRGYEIMSHYGFLVLDTMGSWLTSSLSQGMQSSLSESCSYL